MLKRFSLRLKRKLGKNGSTILQNKSCDVFNSPCLDFLIFILKSGLSARKEHYNKNM